MKDQIIMYVHAWRNIFVQFWHTENI